MNEQEYLSLTGYSSAEWQIMNKKTSEQYLKEKGAVNNMYKISDRKGTAAFGHGCHIVKKKWAMDTMDIMETEGRLEEQIKETPKPPTPPVPPSPPAVPPPPIPVPPVVEDDSFLCDQYDNTTIACDTQCIICRDAEASGITVEEQKKVEELKINKPVVVEHTPKQLERIKRFNDLGFIQEGSEFRRGGISVLTSFVLNSEDVVFDLSISNMEAVDAEHTETMDNIKKDKAEDIIEKIEIDVSNAEEDTKKKIEQIVKDSGVPKENVIIATVPKIDETATIIEEGLDHKADDKQEFLEDLHGKDKTPEEIAKGIKETKPKAEKPKEVVATKEPVKKAKIEGPIPIAPDDIMAQLDLVDDIIKACQVFKKTHYAIHLIQNTLEADDLTPAKKIKLIENAVNNSK
jgi:hypothetical protein